jgi:hypothetical protein
MAAIQFPEERNALVFVLEHCLVDEVEPFAPLDRPFRISQLVLAPLGPRTDSRWERFIPPATRGDAFRKMNLCHWKVLIAQKGSMR